jgi:hypothetical protein
MEGVELFSKTNHDSFLIPSQLLTQPTLPSTPPSDNNNKQPLSPSTPDSPNMASMLNALAQALATYPEGYDSDKLMYVHRENRNRKLFCVGLAQPDNFHPNGTIKGPQPTENQSKTIRNIFHGPNTDDPIDRIPSPVHTSPVHMSPVHMLATEDESNDSSTNSYPEGQPSPTLEEAHDGLPYKSPR